MFKNGAYSITDCFENTTACAISLARPVPAAKSATAIINLTVNPRDNRRCALILLRADRAVGVPNALRILRASPPLEWEYLAGNFAEAHEQHAARCLSSATVSAELSVIMGMLRDGPKGN